MTGSCAHRLGWRAAIVALIAGAAALAPGVASAASTAQFTCTLSGSASLTPAAGSGGGSGTYSMSGQLVDCASGPSSYTPSSADAFSSSGKYSGSSCGALTLTGTFTIAGQNTASGTIAMSEPAGPMTLRFTQYNSAPVVVDNGSAGLATLAPTSSHPGPSDCADTLAVNGELYGDFSF